MKDFKLTIGFAAGGFILSFVFSLFSGSHFLRMLILAVISAVIFAGLSILIQFIYGKFLTIDGDTLGESEGTTGTETPAVGQRVNIIIQDQELEQSGNSNHFDVGNNHQMLNPSDVSKASSMPLEDINAKEAFVPIRSKETVENISGVEASAPEEKYKNNAAQAAQIIDDAENDELGVLPDMSEFSVENVSANDNGENGGESSGESFADYSTSSYSSQKSEAPGEIKDAALIAKAISSVLSGES